MKKSDMASLFRAVLILLSLLNLCVLLLVVLLLKPIWIGFNIALFVLLAEMQLLVMKWKIDP
jgi:hypothetical protein